MTAFDFAPELDVFVARHLSIGGTAVVDYTHIEHQIGVNENPANTFAAGGDGYWALGLLPRIGYAIPLGDHVALWPRLSGGITAIDHVSSDNPGPVPTPFEFHATIDAPIIYRIDRRFFASISPRLFMQGAPKLADVDQSDFNIGFGTDVRIGFVL